MAGGGDDEPRLLTNLEVLELVELRKGLHAQPWLSRERRRGKGRGKGKGKGEMQEGDDRIEVRWLLENVAASLRPKVGAQTHENIVALVATLRAEFPDKLLRSEILQLVNLCPACPVAFRSMIDDSASRFSEEQIGTIVDLIARYANPPAAPETAAKAAAAARAAAAAAAAKVDDSTR